MNILFIITFSNGLLFSLKLSRTSYDDFSCMKLGMEGSSLDEQCDVAKYYNSSD